MSRTVLVSAATALVVALVVSLIARPPADDPSPGPVPVRAPDEVGELRERVAVLEARLANLAAAPPAAAPVPPPPEEAPAPAAPSASEADLEKWLERLRSENESEAFKAALELGQLGDPRAAGSLIETLESHRDYYVRLAAATALGELGIPDTVPPLIEALDERDALVRTAASDALRKITGKEIHFAQEFTAEQREAAQAEWRAWWEENEGRLRDR